jgi:histidyl-tRNA synthetase
MDDQNTKKSLSTEPYKGVRDFYPEDMFIQKYIFDSMRKAVESFGYVEYSASILEPTELYRAKSGEEIINEQTYSFKDRGDRDVTLRPEMTPTVTRMVAAKRKELSFPLRWYSIPNLFRYEKPQRGRLREHYQLNVDIFGIDTHNAEVEIISVASAIMKQFGAQASDFTIKVNNRKILNYLLQEVFTLTDENAYKVMKLIDKKDKITAAEFKEGSEKIIDEKHLDGFIAVMGAHTIQEFEQIALDRVTSEIKGVKETKEILGKLAELGITNAVFDVALARGFDYYTGIVFEVRDSDPANPRSMFGGGRFDDLLSIFGSEKVPSVGFGMGDVTIKDFLETHHLLPPYTSPITIALCTLNKEVLPFTQKLAQELRAGGVSVSVDITDKKLGDQIKWADKQSIPYVLCIGENEIKDQKYVIKELSSKQESIFQSSLEIIEFLKKQK